MSKYYIVVDKNNNEFINPRLIKKSLLSNKKYELNHSYKLQKALEEGKINYKESSKGKSIKIDNMDDVINYSPKSKEIIKKNNIKKIIATAAMITGIGAGIFALTNKEKNDYNDGYSKYEHSITLEGENKVAIPGNSISAESITRAATPDKIDDVHKEEIEQEVIDNEKEVIIPPVIEKEIPEIKTPDDEQAIKATKIMNHTKEDYVFQFDYEDRSNDFKDMILGKYEDVINLYAETYGIDAKLVTNLICQENPENVKNYGDIGGYGLMGIESVHNNNKIYAYNFMTNSNEIVTVDTNRCREDDEYCIKIGTMTMSYCYNYIKSKNKDKRFSPEEEIIITLCAYNKGIGRAAGVMNNSKDLLDFTKKIRNTEGGDNDYLPEILSRFKDGDSITLKDKNGNETSITFDNINVDTYKKGTSL